jgi:hypothetical protein
MRQRLFIVNCLDRGVSENDENASEDPQKLYKHQADAAVKANITTAAAPIEPEPESNTTETPYYPRIVGAAAAASITAAAAPQEPQPAPKPKKAEADVL